MEKKRFISRGHGTKVGDWLSMSASTLKYIAVITMLIDHLAAAVLCLYTSPYIDHLTEGLSPTKIDILYFVMRYIGRQAFPIYCFLLVEGFYHTRSVKNYLMRLFVFALISEVPFDLAFHEKMVFFEAQNVFWTLFLGLLAITILEFIKTKQNLSERQKQLLMWLVSVFAVCISYFGYTDYRGIGIVLILVFYFCRYDRRKACICGGLCLSYEIFAFPAFFLIYYHKGVKGKGNKYFFYLFYPVHLTLLVLLRIALTKG